MKVLKLRFKYLGAKILCYIYDLKRSIYFLAIFFAFLSIYFVFYKRDMYNSCATIFLSLVFAIIGRFKIINIGDCLQFIEGCKRAQLTMRGSLKGLGDNAVFRKFFKSLNCAFGNKNIINSKHTYVFVHTHDRFAYGMLKIIYKNRGIPYTDDQWDIDRNSGISNVVNEYEVKIIRKTGTNIMLASRYSLFTSIESIKEVFEKMDYYDLSIPKNLFTENKRGLT